jgi:S-adenosylmethionine hydrolase
MAGDGAFDASGVITLTSDFGLQDPFVGVMKGQILARFHDARIVDLTHEVLAHWPVEAGFWLARAYRYFPQGTVHVAVVDPGVGGSRGIAVVEGDGHLFLAPDNGLLGNVVEALTAPRLRQLSDSFIASLGVTRPSATFHGRDIFAPVAAELAAGRAAPDSLGERVDELVPGLARGADPGWGTNHRCGRDHRSLRQPDNQHRRRAAAHARPRPGADRRCRDPAAQDVLRRTPR